MSIHRTVRRVLTPAVAAVVILAPLPAAPVAAADGGAVVISQVYGGGGNSGATYTHDFIELVNRGDAEVDLAGWSVQYASAAGSTWRTTALSGTLPAGGYHLVRQSAGAGGSTPLPDPDSTGSIAMAAASGKVALVTDTEALSGTCPEGVADLVGYGSANCFEGSGGAPTLANPTSALRAQDGCQDTDDNAADFAAETPTPRNSTSPAVDCDVDPGDPDVEVTCPTSPVPGADVSTTETYAAERGLSATSAEQAVTDFTVAVEPAPTTGVIDVADVEPAPEPGGTATAVLQVGADVEPGTYTATVTASGGGAEGSCTARIEVLPLVPIGDVQGSIADDQTSFTSPLLGERVAVRGVVTQVTRESNGNRGFFLQERADATDGDPLSSDGVFVFNGNFTTLRTEAEGPARDQVGANWSVAIGDEIVLRGEVGQYFGMTQFAGSSAFVWDVTDSGLNPSEVVAVTEIEPPDDAEDSTRYFRRNLGMQMRVPADSVVVSGRDVFSGTDAEVWAIRGDHPVAQRTDPYARRVFRDAHPLDNDPGSDFDDGNGYRFVLGSFGLKGAEDDPDAVLAPARTFDTIAEDTAGGVYLSFGKYTVNVADQLTLDAGPDPAANAQLPEPDAETEYSIASYNVENLYDVRNDPNSGCDFDGDPGCSDGDDTVNPPFDYVPADDSTYQSRLERIAEQIRLDLHAPDILLIQETEKQDVCTVAEDWTPESGPGLGADRLDCDLENTGEDNTGTDGSPDSLTELALVIAEQGGPRYEAAFDVDAGDLRGITTAFLYRTDRVELLPADADHPVLGSDPALDYDGDPLPSNGDTQNPKAVNASLPDRVADRCTGSGPNACDGTSVFTRAAQVGLFRVWRGPIGVSSWVDVHLVNNHFSSGPDNRVRQRAEQAAYNAVITDALLAADADAQVLIGGDFNVFPRPDDPYPPGTPIPGVGDGPSDQLRAMYDSDLTSLYDRLLADHPSAAYTFGFAGQAQTLDQLWVTPALVAELNGVGSAKVNADWPSDASGEDPAHGRFGVSDHDPEAALLDHSPTSDSVDALLRRLVADGRMARYQAAPVRLLVAEADRQQEADRDRAADRLLRSAEQLVAAYQRAGRLAAEVAEPLRTELRLLRS